MKGLHTYRMILSNVVTPQKLISQPAIELALGSKAFEITEILPHMNQLPEQLNGWFPPGSVRFPFDKLWFEWNSTEYGFYHPDPELHGSNQSLAVLKLNPRLIRVWCVVHTYGNHLVVSEPADIPLLETPDAERESTMRCMVLCAIYLINSSHTEVLGHKVNPSLKKQLIRRNRFWPEIGWSEVKIRPGETITIAPTTHASGWRLPWHEVRGHFRWYKAKDGVEREDRSGLWARKWIYNYERGSKEVGVKLKRYKVMKPIELRTEDR